MVATTVSIALFALVALVALTSAEPGAKIINQEGNVIFALPEGGELGVRQEGSLDVSTWTDLKNGIASLERRAAGVDSTLGLGDQGNSDESLTSLVGDLIEVNQKITAATNLSRDNVVNTLIQQTANLSTLLAAQTTELAAQKDALQKLLAISLAQQAACVPYVEFKDAKGECTQLSPACAGDTFQVTRPTRTSDRACKPKTKCSKTEYESENGGSSANRECAKVTLCKTTEYETSPPTVTSNRECTTIPGTSSNNPISHCKDLLTKGKKSGHYFLKSSVGTVKTYCDMTTDGGGWILVGRGNGNERSCWQTNSDCNLPRLADDYSKGGTVRMSDGRINSFSYSRIRQTGEGCTKGSQYWFGKNDPAGGCTYRHTADATGRCNCASLNVGMTSMRCGRNHWTHDGVGDWPNSGCLHSNHRGEWWYHKKQTGCGSHNRENGYCYGRGNTCCDITLWIR